MSLKCSLHDSLINVKTLFLEINIKKRTKYSLNNILFLENSFEVWRLIVFETFPILVLHSSIGLLNGWYIVIKLLVR